MVSEVTASVKLAIGGAIMPSAVAMPMATKANSPPGPSSRPVSIAAGQGTRNSRASPMMRAALMAIRPATEASSQNGSRASSRRSIPMPTVKKNRPSSSPLKGSMVVSMALRYSVSASSRPATKAPSAMESPAMPGDEAGAEDHEQRRRHEQVAGAARCHQPEQRPQQQPADQDDQPHRQRRVGERQGQAREQRAARARAQDRDQQQQRHHGQVLRQQDGETRPSGGGRQPALVGQHLDDDGGRRQGETHAQ